MKERDFYKISDFWKILYNVIYQSDVLLEVADARMPDLTRNKKLENIIQRKKRHSYWF